MDRGKIIFLNGVSSSGKSTLAKALQKQLSTPYYLQCNDTYMYGWREDYMLAHVYDVYIKLQPAMHQTIRVFADNGIDSIIDHLLLSPFKGMDDFVSTLHDYDVMLVHVTCSVEELRRREKARGDRQIGQAESQIQYLEPKDTYDLTVDTELNTTDECVAKIIECLEHPENWSAIKELWAKQQNK